MAKPVQIFADVSQGSLFFQNTRLPAAPLGGVVLAVQNPSRPNRIRVTREDMFNKDGVTPRRLFKRLEPSRVKNRDGQFLVGDLGFSLAQVVDYINDQATKKANEIDFKRNGSLVGGGTTVNFTGAGVSNVTVSGDVATVTIAGGGNPVASGIVTGAGSTTLRLTLNDSSNVDIDVTSMRSTTSIGSSTNYFFLNSGAQLANNQHDKAGGVVFYGEKLRRGEEILFAIPSEDLHVGIWNGGNGVTGITNVNNKSNWSTKWYYDQSDDDWDAKNGTYAGTGVELNKDIVVENGTYAIRFDYNTQKLQLWEISTAYPWLLSSANVAVGATQTDLFFSSEEGTQAATPGSLPAISMKRSSEWTLESYAIAPTDTVIHSGFNDDDIWKSTRSMRPGMKMKATLNADTKLHHWGVGYGGTVGLGNGPLNPYGEATGSWRSSNAQELRAEENSTFNNNYTGAVNTSTNSTLNLAGRNISWRYNSNNSWDLFDEDTDEVIVSGDNNLDGGDMYPYLFGASTINNYQTEIPQWTWEWNQKAWFMEYRDWSSGHNGNTALNIKQNTMPLKKAVESLETGSGFHTLTQSYFNITWGEKLRPGQEFTWTQLTLNSNNVNQHNMIIGVLNSTFTAYDAGIRFFRAGGVKEQADQDSGFTLAAGISTATSTAGASMRLRYDFGTKKLVCFKVESGVRTKIGESTSALDGNPVFISLGGNSTRMPTSVVGVEVYGWEIAHEPPNYYNPWKNWRIGGFPENQTSVGPGIHSTGNVLAYAADQVWRHKDGLAAGYKMHWLSPATHPNAQIGQWSASNASSGLSNLENVDSFWDWSWQHNTSEEIDAVKGWTFNTSNSNYSSTKWTDPNPGSTKLSLRYHSNNTMDLFDESNSEVIITKSVANDGNPIFISWTVGGATSTVAQMNDDFFGGGDVGIALTTASV